MTDRVKVVEVSECETKVVLQVPGVQGPSGNSNFSYYLIEENESVIVRDGHEMLHHRDLMVRGTLIIRGDVCQV